MLLLFSNQGSLWKEYDKFGRHYLQFILIPDICSYGLRYTTTHRKTNTQTKAFSNDILIRNNMKYPFDDRKSYDIKIINNRKKFYDHIYVTLITFNKSSSLIQNCHHFSDIHMNTYIHNMYYVVASRMFMLQVLCNHVKRE